MFVLCLSALVLATSLADESVNATEASDDGFFNNVDMANLLLDYNADWGPNKTVTVTLSTYIIHASWSNQKLKATLYFRQRWRDHRLAFVGSKDIQISSRFEIWEPDTFLTTSLKTSKSGDRFRRLSPDGTVFKSVKMTATVPCPTTVEQLWANDGVVSSAIFLDPSV
uniref:Neurotransmitter-gated ion-channel ligand-binding domain-containing protein n=1 Tax=Plectus sambesii TaxID=2011161 RepID=A0A914WKW5_9BILA